MKPLKKMSYFLIVAMCLMGLGCHCLMESNWEAGFAILGMAMLWQLGRQEANASDIKPAELKAIKSMNFFILFLFLLLISMVVVLLGLHAVEK